MESVTINLSLNRYVSLLCAIALFVAVLSLPIIYYAGLRVLVFIGALLIIIKHYKAKNYWLLLFIGIAILFNPIIPIYLYQKALWIPLDIIAGLLFLLDFLLILKRTSKKEVIKGKTVQKVQDRTRSRDRIF